MHRQRIAEDAGPTTNKRRFSKNADSAINPAVQKLNMKSERNRIERLPYNRIKDERRQNLPHTA